jgi:hypothetical protein
MVRYSEGYNIWTFLMKLCVDQSFLFGNQVIVMSKLLCNHDSEISLALLFSPRPLLIFDIIVLSKSGLSLGRQKNGSTT